MSFLLLGCGGDDRNVAPVADGGAGADAMTVADGAVAPVSCAALAGMKIASDAIGLPTTGAVVTSALVVPAGDAGGAAVPAHCLVAGSVMPVDPTAPNIDFAVALPATWNLKAVLLGGGGFDGTIPDVTGNLLNATPTALTPLARGYAVFASDGGHQSTAASPGSDASSFVNDEAYENWVGDAPKKVHDSAMPIVRAFYGQAPQKAYVAGSSTGGREALAAVARFPADWDGAIALYPARDVTVLGLAFTSMAQALAAPGAFPDAAKRGVMDDAVLAACDALDGAADGIVSDIATCNTTFDPTVTRCAGGADTGDTCLSDAQIGAFKAIQAPVTFPSALADGETQFPGYNVYGAAQGIGTMSPLEPLVELVDLGTTAPTFPVGATNAFSAGFSDGLYRFAIARDPSVNYLTFAVSTFGAYAARIATLSTLDTADRDLSGFARKGGKLLVMQGTADMIVSARETEAYVAAVQAALGSATAASFLLYYEVPGLQHEVSTTFYGTWDQLGALERWVEGGVDPAQNEVVLDLASSPTRTRPLCLYPAFPKYNGSGDMNAAASFTCATH